jgi:hypothetical protein
VSRHCPIRHDFEGELLTIAEIRNRVPVISEQSIREHLAAGRNSRQAMLCYRPRHAKPGAASAITIRVEKNAAHERRRKEKAHV